MSVAFLVCFVILFMPGHSSGGIKFSAESFAEISLLAKEGKTHLESLREKANVPQFGPCWRNAISDLQIGCKFLSENVQSDLALRFTDCFLQMSGHEALNCNLPKTVCLKKLSDRAFNAYTEFYTHTQSICYFLQSQIWHEETEKTIDKLSLTSHQVSQKLEEAGEIQEKLLNQQKESLSLQHDLNNNSKQVVSALQTSQDKINVFMKDFQITATEQKELLVDVFENLVLFRSWAANELSWFSSTVYFTTATVITFLFTSVSRTREARIIILILFAFNYCFERLLASSLQGVFLGGYFTLAPESLNSVIWLCRKFCICLGIIILIYTAFNYYDYNVRNYQLLLEIKNQNLKILDHFAMKGRNQYVPTKNNLNEMNNAIKNRNFSVSPKSHGSGLNAFQVNEKYQGVLNNSRLQYELIRAFDGSPVISRDVLDCEENKPLDNISVASEKESRSNEKYRGGFNNLRPQHESIRVSNGSHVISRDVLDCEENKPLDNISVSSEKESISNELKYGYNLRSLKSRKIMFC